MGSHFFGSHASWMSNPPPPSADADTSVHTGLSPTVRSHARPAALEDLAATVVASPTASRVGSRLLLLLLLNLEAPLPPEG